MDLLANDYPDVILAARAAPCLTLYQPTHRQHPGNLQDPIRFGNLVKQLRQSLQKKYPQRDIDTLLAPLHALAGDSKFWNHTLDGLAVLVATDFFRAYRLQRPGGGGQFPHQAVAAHDAIRGPLPGIGHQSP